MLYLTDPVFFSFRREKILSLIYSMDRRENEANISTQMLSGSEAHQRKETHEFHWLK